MNPSANATASAPALHLPGYDVLGSVMHGTTCEYRVRVSARPGQCPQCHGGSLSGYGRRPRRVTDCPVSDVKIVLIIEQRRYRCRDCTHTFSEPLPLVDPRRALTVRLAYSVWLDGKTRSLRAVAAECGIAEATVRAVMRDRGVAPRPVNAARTPGGFATATSQTISEER